MQITLLAVISGVTCATFNELPTNLNWWQWLLISIGTTLIGLIFDLIREYFHKKDININPVIIDKVENTLKDKCEDLIDDGKLNNSNKED